MSLAVPNIQPALVYDSRLDYDNQKFYSVLRGGKDISYTRFASNSVSTTQINFLCPPPSGVSTVIDRRIFVQIPVRAKFTFVTVGADIGALDARPDCFAPRSFPLSKALANIEVIINDCTITTKLGDYFNALERYMDREVCKHAYTGTPCAMDKWEFGSNAADSLNTSLGGLAANPLAGYGNSSEDDVDAGRGGFSKFRIISITPGLNDRTTLTADLLITEPIIMAPMLLTDRTNAMGFYNVNKFEVRLNFYPGCINRMFEYMPLPPDNSRYFDPPRTTYQFNNFGATPFSFGVSQPFIYINYLTPPPSINLNSQSIIQYPYFNYDHQATDIEVTQGNPTLVTQALSNNYQLRSIPRRVYIYISPDSSTYNSTIVIPDVFLAINGINVTFENSQTLLANASVEQLYQISVKNGYNGSYSDFTKGPIYQNAFSYTLAGNPLVVPQPTMYLSGSVICLEFGTDIKLQDIDTEAPGCNANKTYNFAVTVNYTNPPFNYTTYNNNATVVVPRLKYQLHCVFCYEGVISLGPAGQCAITNDPLSASDVKNSIQQPGISYSKVQNISGGSVNFSTLQDVTKNIYDAAKKINKAQKSNQGYAMAAELASNLGVMNGGVLLTGGAKRSKLSKKLRN